MSVIKIKVLNKDKNVLSSCESDKKSSKKASLVHNQEYKDGDTITVETNQEGFYKIKLEDTMETAVVFIKGSMDFHIPPVDNRLNYSPKSFTGNKHLITAELADKNDVYAYRCLSFNPYDSHENTSCFPHAYANVETRNEAVFAARNAIDGIYENSSHGDYPYQSWGINRDPNAELTVDFGFEVRIDKIGITLRADFPHDNYWISATVKFSDGSRETLSLIKTAETQEFPIAARTITGATLCELIKSDDPSPFPALTQIEYWGNVINNKED